MKLIITPTLKIASNDKERSHLYELAAQRISKYVEPTYVSNDMLRGHEDELEARILYDKHYAPVQEAGFVTNDKWGFTIGYSPDGLVGDDGLIECKSRRQKYQFQTIVEYLESGMIDADYVIQAQTGFMVSERLWIDHLSYSGGYPMTKVRIYPDLKIMNAIEEAAGAFEARIAEKLARYRDIVARNKLIPTERKIIQEMFT